MLVSKRHCAPNANRWAPNTTPTTPGRINSCWVTEEYVSDGHVDFMLFVSILFPLENSFWWNTGFTVCWVCSAPPLSCKGHRKRFYKLPAMHRNHCGLNLIYPEASSLRGGLNGQSEKPIIGRYCSESDTGRHSFIVYFKPKALRNYMDFYMC